MTDKEPISTVSPDGKFVTFKPSQYVTESADGNYLTIRCPEGDAE